MYYLCFLFWPCSKLSVLSLSYVWRRSSSSVCATKSDEILEELCGITSSVVSVSSSSSCDSVWIWVLSFCSIFCSENFSSGLDRPLLDRSANSLFILRVSAELSTGLTFTEAQHPMFWGIVTPSPVCLFYVYWPLPFSKNC